jgi:hypothetical protein
MPIISGKNVVSALLVLLIAPILVAVAGFCLYIMFTIVWAILSVML